LRADLSAVTIHTGAVADRLARGLGADAFTCGSAIYFRAGAYRPATRAGLWLLAHEAAHVVQQSAGAVAGLSAPAEASEREADRAADLVLAGRTWAGPAATAVPAIGRHVSFEHRLLGDSPTKDLVAIATHGAEREEVLRRQIELLSLWKDDPDHVTPEQVKGLCPWIETISLGPGELLTTYGELNALPDYLSDAVAFDALDPGIVLPILQVIRQEGYNHLNLLLTDHNPNVTFARAACSPWKINKTLNNIVETKALDALTQGLGHAGQDHYQGLLARNACHFAPFSWYRWQSSYLIARDLAKQAHDEGDQEKARLARIYGGYAAHFLEDSFAAGHLVNKTLVMQWFLEWAQSRPHVPVADWDVIKYMTTVAQPSLAGLWLYDPRYAGPSNDPQTALEAGHQVERMLGTGVLGAGPAGLRNSYQAYLTFISSAAAGIASANLHDYYNDHAVWVSSQARHTPYEVWGDDTLFTGANGGTGVQATSEAAQMSAESLRELIRTGHTSITTQQIRDHFPTKAGPDGGSLTDLRTWTTSQRQFCYTVFSGFENELQKILVGFGAPRLGVVSRDQPWVSLWEASLTDSGYHRADSLMAHGRLFSASNGYVYEIDPVSGRLKHKLHLTTALGGDVTHLATDGTHLFAGVHGFVYGIDLADWSRAAWETGVGGTGAFGVVHLLFSAGNLYAGSNGHVYQMRPADGGIVHELRLTSPVGGAETRLATDDTHLFAGVHGFAYAVSLADWTKAAWEAPVGGTGSFGIVTVLYAGTRLFVGSDGYVYDLRPADGSNRYSLRLSSAVGGAEVRLATDGIHLFAGTHGYVYGVLLGNWSAVAWYVGVGTATSYGTVSVAATGGSLFAASNGYAYDIDPGTGTITHSSLLTYRIGVGSYDATLIADGQNLYAGVHGSTYKLLFNHIPPPGGTIWHAFDDGSGWHAFDDDLGGAPKASSVFAIDGVAGNTELFAVAADGTLYHTTLVPNFWHIWVPDFQGAPKMASVTGVNSVRGTTEMLAIGTDGVVYHNYLDASGSWHQWTPNPASAPQAVSVLALNGASGKTEVFAVGLDATLYHNVLDGTGWHEWTADFDDAPKVRWLVGVRGATGDTELFCVDVDRTLHHNYLDGSGNWHGWTPNFEGAPKSVSVFAGSGGAGRADLFVIGTDSTLHHNWQDGTGWQGWTADFDGAPKMRAVTAPISKPSAVPGMDFFGVAVNGKLHADTVDANGNWSGWRAGFAADTPLVTWRVFSVPGPTGNSDLFVIAGS
jgi:hypothetical protein